MRAVNASDPTQEGKSPAESGFSLFVPVLLVSLAVVASLAFQAVQLAREQQQLSLALTNLEAQQQAAVKLRAALDAVATATAGLAANGNANARSIVDELRKRGVTITPQGESKPK
jgi:type II secretory pathway component PulJ